MVMVLSATFNNISTTVVQCPLDVTKFPFDIQTCTLQFGSWIYNGFQVDINIKNDHADLTSMMSNVEWVVDKVTGAYFTVLSRQSIYTYIPIQGRESAEGGSLSATSNCKTVSDSTTMTSKAT
jgi:hypothetical protein